MKDKSIVAIVSVAPFQFEAGVSMAFLALVNTLQSHPRISSSSIWTKYDFTSGLRGSCATCSLNLSSKSLKDIWGNNTLMHLDVFVPSFDNAMR